VRWRWQRPEPVADGNSFADQIALTVAFADADATGGV
jgi:hypothetical protein